MTRRLEPEVRHRVMASIRSKDTRIEKTLRSTLWRLGFRFRKHFGPFGRADVAFPKKRVVIFLDSCFWHACPEHFRLRRFPRVTQ